MCLHKVIATYDPPIKLGVGYKLFIYYPARDELRYPFFSNPQKTGGLWDIQERWTVPFDKPQHANRNHDALCDVGLGEEPGSYKLGFHVFLHEADAIEWGKYMSSARVCQVVVCTVEWRNAHTLGEQSGLACFVVEEITVLKHKMKVVELLGE